ncbi:MAG: mucoidy inhibitor MuiA family protein [Pseudomonadota bacterium]
MRSVVAFALCMPTMALAEVFTVSSLPNEVTVYMGVAEVTRRIELSVLAGNHDILLPDLPQDLDEQSLRIGIGGAVLQSIQFRREGVQPTSEPDTAEIIAAKDRIKRAEDALADLQQRIDLASVVADGALAKTNFLSGLGENEGLSSDAATLRALVALIDQETQSARRDIVQTQAALRVLEAERPALEKEREDAERALIALTPPPAETAQLRASVFVEDPTDVSLELSYFVQADWTPVYDIILSEDDAAEIQVRRAAKVRQNSAESWQNVVLMLSTFPVTQAVGPSDVLPERLTFGSAPINPRPQLPSRVLRADAGLPGGEVAQASTSFDGPGVTYKAPDTVSLARDVDEVTVALDTLTFSARRFARAVPSQDPTAFLMARFRNDTDEPLLASDAVSLYRENTLIGRSALPLIPAGAETTLPFGAIDALQLSYVIVDQSEGDRGFMTRSNAKTERSRLDIANIGNQDWDVEVQSVVPHAVQDDLVIEWTATPTPDIENVDDKRGVLQWDIAVPAGQTTSITVEKDIGWPEGNVLQ